jgi:Na+-driven multidrug efflux pump
MNMMTNRSKWLGPTIEISFAAWALPIAIAVALYNFWIVLDGQAYGQFDHPGMSDAAYDSIYVAGGFGVGLVLALVLWLPLLIAALISRFVFRAGGVYW